MSEKRKSVTVTLTPQELTDIRVAVLCRLDLIGKPRADESTADALEREARYDRIHSLMRDGGVLHRAMLESLSHYIKEVL